MTRSLFALALSVASASSLACATAPEEPDGLSLTASISRSIIPLGDTATLSFQLKNVTGVPISLTFGSSCQVTPFIELDGNGVVYPPGASYGCFAVITTLTVPPYGEHIVTQTVRGGTAQQASSIPVLAPATYRAYAFLEHNSRQIQLRSQAVVFVVQ